MMKSQLAAQHKFAAACGQACIVLWTKALGFASYIYADHVLFFLRWTWSLQASRLPWASLKLKAWNRPLEFSRKLVGARKRLFVYCIQMEKVGLKSIFEDYNLDLLLKRLEIKIQAKEKSKRCIRIQTAFKPHELLEANGKGTPSAHQPLAEGH